MTTNESVTTTRNEKRLSGFRTRAAVAVGTVLLATGAAWAANDVANNLCHPVEASAIGGHPQPAGFCGEYEGFKEHIGNGADRIVDFVTPEFPIITQPVYDPNAPVVG